MIKLIALPFIAVLLMNSLLAGSAAAQWVHDPTANTPISLAAGEKNDVFVVPDGAGGAIIVWEDERSGAFDIYAQRLDVNGRVRWTEDGIAICTATGDQHLYNSSTSTTGFAPVMPDGDGGAFIVWHDARRFSTHGNDIYCQRIDAAGRILFAADGLLIAGGMRTEDQPTLCSDGTGGAIIVWQDKNDEQIFYNLYGQRIDARGVPLWNEGNRVAIATAGFDQDGPTLAPDGHGGAFVAWQDSRDNLNDVYAQRLNAAGAPLWTPNGRVIYQHEYGQDALTVLRAEDGNAILAWVDRRSGSPDIYAQKLDAATGAGLWTATARAVCTASESQYRPALCTDGLAGAIISWYDFRNAPSGPPWNLDIYAQRILADGSAAWPVDGVAVCAAPDAQRDADLCTDGRGGALVVWEDNRDGTGYEDIYAQRLDGAGIALLQENGRLVSSALNNQQRPDVIAGAGGLLAAWKDDRDVLYAPDVYADRVLTTTDAVIGLDRVLIDFGLPAAGVVADSFAVSNVGASDLAVTAVGLAEPDPSFEIAYPRALPDLLAPDEIVGVIVRYQAAALRSVAADLLNAVEIHHDAPDMISPAKVRLRVEQDVTAISPAVPPYPVDVILVQNQPNPFNPTTRIGFRLFEDRAIQLSVFSLTGRRITTLADAVLVEGQHVVSWDGTDACGRPVASGPYIYRLAWERGSATRKMMLLR